MRKLRLAIEILRAYVVVRWSLRLRGVTTTLTSARCPHGGVIALDGGNQQATAERLAVGVQKTLGVLPLDSRCLIRSLVLTRLMARRGLDSTVVFAARTQPEFAAHSWVEYRGVPLLPTGDGFHRLKEL